MQHELPTDVLPATTAQGKSLRDAGMQQAAEHADREYDGWQDIALAAFREYARTHVTFTTEDVRTANTNVPVPPDKRAWGTVARRAVKESIVQKIGMVQAKSPTVHAMYVAHYESLVLDTSRTLEDAEWLKLARNYVRAYRGNMKRNGFFLCELEQYAGGMGCPRAPDPQMWVGLLEAEGLEYGLDGWRERLCCPECAEKHS